MRVGSLARAADWWHYKLPPLLGVAYLCLERGGVGAAAAAPTLLLILATAVGTAAFGHLLNDWTDLEADCRAGRPSALSGSTPATRFALAGTALALALAPWALLPRSPLNVALFGGELVLFAAYSLPPLRLKERGAAGMFCDALYGHALPVAVVAATFQLAAGTGGASDRRFFAALVAWKLVQGVSSALVSQARDRRADRRAGVRTFALAIGPRRALGAANRLLPLHAAAFVAALALAGRLAPWLLAALAVHVGATAWRLHVRYRKRASFYRRESPAFPYLHDFQERWLPLVPLAALAADAPGWLAIALGHVVLFRSGLDPLLPWRRRRS